MEILKPLKRVTLHFKGYKILFIKTILTYFLLQSNLKEQLNKYYYLTFAPFTGLDILSNLGSPLTLALARI